MHVNTAFFKHFNAGIPIHNATVSLDFERLSMPWLQGLYDSSRWLLAPIIQCDTTCTSFQGLI